MWGFPFRHASWQMSVAVCSGCLMLSGHMFDQTALILYELSSCQWFVSGVLSGQEDFIVVLLLAKWKSKQLRCIVDDCVKVIVCKFGKRGARERNFGSKQLGSLPPPLLIGPEDTALSGLRNKLFYWLTSSEETSSIRQEWYFLFT